MDLISVIVPVYNVEQYLMRCVDSIRRQTYQNIEIILVDDGSPDNCPQMCEEIRQMDTRVRVIHKKNGGLGFARNSGLDAANGSYVTFIDSDDWISDDHIENLYREAKRTAADVVIGSHTLAASDGTFLPHSLGLRQEVYEGATIQKEIVLPLIGAETTWPDDVQLHSSSCMNLYKLEVINQNNIRFRSEKEAVAEDMFFNVDFLCNANRVAAIDEIGYFYFENLASISRKYDSNRFERTICFYEMLKQQVLNYGLQDVAAFRVERTFLMKIRVALRLLVLSDSSRKEKYDGIQQILDHRLIKEVLSYYPINTYIPAMRLLAKLMRRGKVRGVYGLIVIREYAKRTTWLKAMLKHIGIGK